MRLDLSYDGTDFNGWAIQPGQRTVQGVLGEELARILRIPIPLTVAGRTDSGVHATGQVAHIDVPRSIWTPLRPTMRRRLSGLLPNDVRVRELTEVPDAFDARFTALRRWYEYKFTDVPWGAEPLARRDTLAWPRTLDVDAMIAAADGLLGEHNFAAYCRRRKGATTLRELQQLSIAQRHDGVYVTTVVADAFCHSMVRSLIGSLLAVGEGRRPLSWPAELLSLRARATDVTVAPPHGLTLVQVDYPADEHLAARGAQTRRLRVPVELVAEDIVSTRFAHSHDEAVDC